MKIKVIIKDGIVQAILKDQDTPVHVELIDTSDSCHDGEIEKYAQSLLSDQNYLDCDYSVADFDECDTPQ